MKIRWKPLLICLAIPLAAGGLSAALSGGMNRYPQLIRPPLSPPGWVFPVVWTLLYVLMGCACYLALSAEAEKQQKQRALLFYAIQLLLNFIWAPVFFGFQAYWTAFVLLLLLWAFLYLTMHLFSELDEWAENLLIPYLLWVTFAGYLNLGVALLN